MKRFYKEVAASASADGGYTVLLDGKAVKTPKRVLLTLPNLPLADAIAEEWRTQGESIDPQTMPLTRLAFAALDVVTPEREQIAQQLLKYARNDLLCYRAEDPPELAARQAHAWDPLLDWAAETYGARLKVGFGIKHVAQPAEGIAELEQAISRYDEFELATLHTATTITGSLILALALAEEEFSAHEAFAAATIDEAFQAEKWGIDTEAENRRQRLLSELTAAERFLRLLET
ncbi:MAG TPA: ATP12 family protein [Rhizomicrobium sp.]|jgi:chaperone required for assembly of F1-ATPase|nr:ATP12 family protein [Rhizomicrobium sp.]